ncbi:selenocysteine lyase [Xylariaceae sp. FL1019]|nr:selenocysteine lyase [Xylariaceae sp. FL1019]
MDTQPIIELAPNGLPRPDPMLSKWSLRQDVVHMDHGSSGACPTEILEYQNALRWDLDRGSPEFFLSAWSPRHRASKERLSKFVGADYDELLLTPGSTLGLNIVTQSQQFQPGDELLTTNHAYSSVTMLLKHVANRDGAKVVIANVPFPVASPDDIVASIMACVTERTKFAIIDHIVSRTGLVFPIKRIVAELAARGIDTLVDGAHGPGQVQVDLHDIGAAYYTTSCHKWMCAPRGVGFMYARRDRISKLKPLIIARSGHWRDTNGAGYTWLEHTFEWNGCHDPSGVHSMPKIIDFLDTALPGGHAAMVKRNHDLAVEARTRVLEILGIAKPCPDDMIANMVTFPLPDSVLPNALGILPICKNLWERERAEIQCYHWPAYPKRIFRFSVQLHNSLEQFLWLASKIKEELENETKLAASLQTGESSGDAVVQNWKHRSNRLFQALSKVQ